MHNPHISVVVIQDSYHKKNVYATITDLRSALGDALTDEVAVQLSRLIQCAYSAGYSDGNLAALNDEGW